jgi:MFS family permease
MRASTPRARSSGRAWPTSRPDGHRLRLLFGISVLWIPLAFLTDGLTGLLLPLRLGGSATAVGLVSFIGLAAGAALQPLAGMVGDRLREDVDRRWFAAAAAVPAGLGLWLLVGPVGVAAAAAGFVIVQLAAAAMQSAQQALIPEHVPTAAQGVAAGLRTAFDVGGSFVAFLVLGIALASGDPGPAAVVIVLVLAITVVGVVAFVPAIHGSAAGRPPATPPRRPIPDALEMPPGLLPLIASRFLFLLATYVVGRFLILLVAQRLGIGVDRAADEAGGVLALLTLATAAAAVAFGALADRRRHQHLMLAGSVLAAAGVLLLVPAAGLAGVLAGGLVMSVGTAAFVTANWAATTGLVPAAEAGRLMGIANLGTAAAAAAAGLFGPLLDAAGFAVVLALVAGIALMAVVPILTASPSPRPSVEQPG